MRDVFRAVDAVDGKGRIALLAPPSAPWEKIALALQKRTRSTVELFSAEQLVYGFDLAIEVTPTNVFSWVARVTLNRRASAGAQGVFFITQEGWVGL